MSTAPLIVFYFKVFSVSKMVQGSEHKQKARYKRISRNSQVYGENFSMERKLKFEETRSKRKNRSNFKNVYCFYPLSTDQFVSWMRWEPKNPNRNGQLKVKNLNRAFDILTAQVKEKLRVWVQGIQIKNA